MSLLTELPQYYLDGVIRSFDGFRRGVGEAYPTNGFRYRSSIVLEATEAAWKSYDATAKLASSTIDDLYRNPLVGEMTATTLDTMLRWQRANTAMTGAFFTGMWKAMGLPTAGEMQALREEVRSLAEKSQPVELQVKPKIKPAAAASEVVPLHRKVA